jgi:hypothetical protein
MQQLRVVIEPLTPDSQIAASEAIDVANKEYSYDRVAKSVTATLMTVTDPSSREILDKRAVWTVFYAGLDIEGPSIPNADGTVTPGHRFTGAFVFVDANSGEFLMTAYT